MFEEFNNQLIQVKDQIHKKQKWEKQLAEYKQDLSTMKKRIFSLKDWLAKEEEDVHKLESISVTSLFLTVIGKKDERLDKEKEELIAVKLKLDEMLKARSDIESRINALQNKLWDARGSEREYEELLARKEKLIKESHSPSSTKLYEMVEQQGELNAYLTEVDEAIRAGNSVNQSLRFAIESLEKAKGWGTLDMLGGGAISGAVKHNHIDDATSYIYDAQSGIRRFQKELMDINEMTEMQVEISGLLKFADFFFDGLIADWMVQGRIDQSLQQTSKQYGEVNGILTKLNSKKNEVKREIEQLQSSRKTLIESI